MKKLTFSMIIAIVGLFLLSNLPANGCTNFLITKGASVDGSTMITYAADAHVMYGELYFRPAKDYPEDAMLKVYEWDTGKYLGEIEQVRHTYAVIGNMNEHQVAIGETTYGGRSELGEQPGAIIDYGSLIYITLQRAKTAREAIKTMGELVAKYGYYSSGESFSISDPNEVWIMELIGKGKGEKGAVWVARKVPDGYVCGHANQARITTFPLDDPENCLYAEDVISFAREKGWYKGKDKDFSFSDTYAPVDFGGARFCEARVWAMFLRITDGMEEYENYAKGNVEYDKKTGYATNRMPLWVKPNKKISVHDVMNLMRDHFEGTVLDMTKDIGAGPFDRPYRWRPLTWEVDGETYCNERATATQQTGFSFVAQSRSWLPDPIGGIFWFGVDDAASSVYFPMYCGANRVPETFAEGNGSMIEWSDDAAFWVFNQVTNLAYTRYDTIHAEIEQVQQKLEKKYIAQTAGIDKGAKELYESDKAAAIQLITDYSVNTGNALVYLWKDFYKYLFMKYMDGNIKKVEGWKLKSNEHSSRIPANPDQPGYGKDWYKKIIEETGDHFKMKEGGH